MDNRRMISRCSRSGTPRSRRPTSRFSRAGVLLVGTTISRGFTRSTRRASASRLMRTLDAIKVRPLTMSTIAARIASSVGAEANTSEKGEIMAHVLGYAAVTLRINLRMV